jgi:hypothetical protein
MEKLIELFSRCKSTVEISYNQHKSYYDTIGESIGEDIDEVDPEVFKEMMIKDTLIRIQFYPHSSVGFHTVYHYDLEKAVDRCLSILNEG